MDMNSPWNTNPVDAYRAWQEREAAGADRRPFSTRSITQHTAMFDRFLRHLASHGLTVATFGSDDLESFFADIANRCAPGTTTRMRYAKLVDRLCRQLVELGVRKSNPAAEILRGETWPEDEPLPLFLDAGADLRLQAWVDPLATDSPRETRNRAVVALLLGSGIAAGELRHARTGHLVIDAVRSHIFVSKRGPRDERKISLPQFAEPALAAWQHLRRADSLPDTLLFSAPTGDKPINDMLLGMIVREALEAVEFSAPDMSPRVLRNTYARRHLLGGRSNEDVSRLLGLVSQRTVVRLRTTIPAAQASSCVPAASS